MGGLFLPALWGYARYIEPEWLQIKRIPVILPRLAPEFDGYKLVQLSDLHIDAWLGGERLAKIVALVNAEHPDTVAITGDFISRRLAPHDIENLISALSQLSPKDVSVAVLGNHDYKVNIDHINALITQSGLINISNHFYTLCRGSAMFHFAGLDSAARNNHRLDVVLKKLPSEGAAILLAHEPDLADKNAASGRFDLQISGHTHGGQVKIPFWGRPQLPHLGKKYPAGMYRVKDMLLYTNRGVGMGRPPLRFNCRPEITVFTLKSPTVS